MSVPGIAFLFAWGERAPGGVPRHSHNNKAWLVFYQAERGAAVVPILRSSGVELLSGFPRAALQPVSLLASLASP